MTKGKKELKKVDPKPVEPKPIQLTAQEKDKIAQDRQKETDRNNFNKGLGELCKKHNCYLTINGNVQVAGERAFPQLKIVIANK